MITAFDKKKAEEEAKRRRRLAEKEAQIQFQQGRNPEKAKAEASARLQAQGSVLSQVPVSAEEARAKQAEAKDVESQAQELQKKQSQEIAQLDALKNFEPQADALTRMARAGLVPIAGAANIIGKGLRSLGIPFKEQSVKRTEEALPGPAKLPAAVVGKAVNINVPLVGSIADVFYSTNRKNIGILQADAKDNLGEGARIFREAISQGGDVQQTINRLQKLEEGMRLKYSDAEKSLGASPEDLANGLDLYDDMSRDISVITSYRHILERYAITGDKGQALINLGGFSAFEEQNI